jgi:hypothetical protein
MKRIVLLPVLAPSMASFSPRCLPARLAKKNRQGLSLAVGVDVGLR